jgi:hypothetical protein
MGVTTLWPPARRFRLIASGPVPPAAGRRQRLPLDQLVFLALTGLVLSLSCLRREFLGDGVRHLPAILSDHLQFGEPRWLLFPAVANLWVHALSTIGLVTGAESALHALLALSAASGAVFLAAILVWLRRDCDDAGRRAAALVLAGSCAPILILFSDIAEPPLAAAIATASLAYARIHRDDPERARGAALSAVAMIAVASLIYQGTILAFGMLPLVVSGVTMRRRQFVIATVCAVLAVGIAMTGIQVSAGTSMASAVSTIARGEQNPLTRSLMGTRSLGKYAVAAVAGPPQAIVALDSYSGLPALRAALRSENGQIAALALQNLTCLMIGFLVTGILLFRATRDGEWKTLIAAAILLGLPILRNQQYGYVKFYVLWPIPVALLASRCSARITAVLASTVLAVNLWVVGGELRRGRENYRASREAYATATPATCWLTSGWTPPFAYLWPGTSTPILGILATGSRPEIQRRALTTSLRRCFCDSDRVWSDTTTRDARMIQWIASHFDYAANDVLSRVLIDSHAAARTPLPGIVEYDTQTRLRICQGFEP